MSEATASPVKQGVTIRSVHSVEEIVVCVELQQRVWGYTAIDTVPDQIFVVAKKTGGQVMAAYDGDRPIGFALAFAAVRNGLTYLHSHMVAVVEDCQNRGVGRLLKLAQRNDAIERGIDLIEWTFDPLQLKNAFFNIERLGAIVRHYIPNLYGRTSSPLHAGLPTDRLVAEWWVRSTRVENVLSGNTPAPVANAHPVDLPANIREICRDEPLAAEKIQSEFRRQFESHIASGRAAVRFALNQSHGTYLLEPYED
jgi:predicted GNAT superfamily acetyltransferase